MRKQGRFIEFSVFSDTVTTDWSVIGDGKELDMYGVQLSGKRFPDAIELLHTGALRSDGVVTHLFSISEWQKAFETASDAKQSVKVGIIFD